MDALSRAPAVWWQSWAPGLPTDDCAWTSESASRTRDVQVFGAVEILSSMDLNSS